MEGKPSDGPGYSTEHRIHQLVLALLYAIAFLIAWIVLSRPETTATFVALLSTGAILATFGSAISALGTMWERDLIERVKTNVDIFYRDIVKQEEAWRRWPFLPRRSKKLALDNNFHLGELKNPESSLDVGSHVVFEDSGGFEKVREAGRMNFLQASSKSELVVPRYDQTQKVND